MNGGPSPIIYRPNLQKRLQRTVFGAITFALWVLWIYLWLPLITALLWFIGVRVAYVEIFRGARGISLTNLVWVILVALAVMTYWSSYNLIRYGKRSRRSRAEVVSKTSVAKTFGVHDPNTVALLTERRSLELRFSETGQLLSVEPARLQKPILDAEEIVQVNNELLLRT